MEKQAPNGVAAEEEYEHGRDVERPTEPATPADIGALDGAAAAGSAGAVSTDADGSEGGIPAEGPDPSVGPD
jgi:hypothetical protein